MADGKVTIDTDLNTSGLTKKLDGLGSTIKSSLGTVATTAIKGTAIAIAGTTTAIAGLTAQATTAYATYEQMVGGVNTLFGTGDKSLEEYAQSVGKSTEEVKDKYNSLLSAQDTVMKNAANAYMTAGVSANQYMEQVTGFSASLIQSLSGDTEKAAEYADRALIDMSDNANKMGTAMESIQWAYQGFAKQNYTMLDNLKLGYGGTKAEMERLIADASQMTDIQNELNVSVQEGDLSFGNIVNAISVMQKNLGIAGTTAKEAQTTIEGSTKMMKASWENLLVGISDDTQDFEQLIDNFVESTMYAFQNLAPRIQQSIVGVGKLVEGLAPVFQEQLPSIISETLPSLIDSATNTIQILISTLVKLIPTITQDIIPIVLSSGILIITALISGLEDALPSVFQAIVDIFSQLANESNDIFDLAFSLIFALINGISACLPQLTQSAAEIINQLAISMNDNLPMIVEVAVNLLQALADSLDVSLPIILNLIPVLVEAVYKTLNQLIVAGNGDIVDIVLQLLWTLIKNLPVYLNVLIQVTISFLGQMIMAFTDSFMNVLHKATELGSNIGIYLAQAFNNIIPSMQSAGNNIVQGLWQGISNGWSMLTSRVNNLCRNLITNVKKTFGIHSPSKEFDWIGKMNAQGFIQGFDGENPMDQITDSLTAGQNTLQNAVQNDLYNNSTNTLGAISGMSGSTNVNVVLEGDAKQLFRLMRIENDSFKKTSGVNAFA